MSEKHTWVILLRGINVGGVKVPMADLKQMLEMLGMQQVRTLLASGNVVAVSDEAHPGEVKRIVEAALEKTFGRPLSVIVRPHSAIKQMVADAPFAGIEVTKETRLNVTFLGDKVKAGVPLPYASDDGSLYIFDHAARHEDSSGGGGALFSVLDLKKTGTIDAMAIIEKAWGKGVTTRTWNTVEKIAAL